MTTEINYLIHFDTPYKHAQHYLGYTQDLDARLACHRSGNGARLIEVIQNAGIGWRCVRTWPGGRERELQLKARKESPALCPICNPDGWHRLASDGVMYEQSDEEIKNDSDLEF